MTGVSIDTRSEESVGVAARCSCRSSACLAVLCAASVLLASAGCQSVPTFRGQAPEEADFEPPNPEESIADILIEGNKSIPASAINEYIKTQRGRPPSPEQIKTDIRNLYATKWFFSVEPRYRYTKSGLILVFRVVERPMIKNIEYRGNAKVKDKYLAALTGLKVDGPFDVSSNRESVRRIEQHYQERGYPFVKVQLLKGNHRDDREVIFEIEEGNKVVVKSIKFSGNDSFSSGLLRTKVRTKKALLGIPWLGGKYNPETIPDDVASLMDYYHNLGYFDVKIDKDVSIAECKFHPLTLHPFSPQVSYVTIQYSIEEGDRYKVRDVVVDGNRIFSEEELTSELKLASGEFFNARFLNKDVDGIKDRYGKLGRLFARVDAVPRFLEERGTVDLVYQIDEDRVYHIRRVNVHIRGENPHTRETVVLNRIFTHPGDVADARMIKRSEGRLQTDLFERGPVNGPRVQIARVQNELTPPENIFRGQNVERPILPEPPNPIFDNNPYGEPFGRALSEPPGQIDLDYFVTEARTGRLMFGVGVNSDAGVVGSIVLEENNFDILRPPRRLSDFADGTAWRGRGQRFRIEAIPGDIVSRYLFSWSDPYFLDTDFSFGVSGFYYNRFLPDWDEDRLGGRLTLGYQINPEVSVSGAIRLEEVELRNPDIPTPPLLAQAVGTNFLSTARASIAHDTRDTPFLPGEGHFVQSSFEQAFGDFQYPRFEADARQYFTVWSRPDGGGRHIVSLSGSVGWTDSDTPIFERFYAGGFQSFRGYSFRGVGPVAPGTTVRVGGRFQALGSVQYAVPVTADEFVSVVFFSDVGTVEANPGFDDFRVSVGGGVRLTVPAMGPAPIALDWAIPVVKLQTDDERLFSFYIGLTR